MREPDLLQQLTDPACFPGSAGAVEVVQTHISIVALVGDRVFKLKKPVRLPFLDFSTLALRRHFCREEVRLNRRLCPSIYLGTAALRRTPAGLRFDAVDAEVAAAESYDEGSIVDYAVVMRRLPQERMLDQQLAHGTATAADLRALARQVAAFHRDADRGEAVRSAGDPDHLAALAAANFAELAGIGDHGLDARLLAAMAARTEQDFARILPALRRRADAGRVVDGHGDLHARNICMTSPASIYDCIEFEPAFRCGDVATEIAFLAMDLRYRGAPSLADAFVAAYAEAAADAEAIDLLPPLVAYRAMIRAKVAAIAGTEPELAAADRDGARRSAADHLQLAAAAAIDAADARRWLVLCGPPGCGKSTVAAALHRGTAWPSIATDRVRKELAGLAPTAHAAAEHYTTAFSTRTYAEVFARAAAATAAGARTVLLDGNFATPDLRAAAATAAARAGAAAIVLHIDVPADLGLARVTARLDDPARISDAGPAEHAALRARFVAPTANEGLPIVALDGREPASRLAAGLLTQLIR